ncbi:MAG: InlB B-repeat-containing protein [Paludibacteraceae bacterium]|nr:InlB B-repeat-containing protein [Paludibacteraceae bacterium]
MKKIIFKSMLLLCALIVGSGSLWATEVTFTPGTDTGATSVTKNGVTCTMTTMNNSSYYQIYANASGTFSIESGKITKIEFTCTASGTSKYGPGNASADVGSYSYDEYTGTWTGDASSITISSTAQVRMSSLTITYTSTPAFTINAQSNNNSYGTVSLDGNVITGSPKSGYRYATSAYSVSPANSATVAQNGDEFTVTPKENTTVTINFEAIPTYTVSFDAVGGSCDIASRTESLGGQGVTLPTATIDVTGWEFIGWAAATVANTSTLPTLYKAGSTYKPASDLTLHAVYTLKETGSTYKRVTSASQVEFAKSVVVVYNANSYILDHSKSTTVAAPTESNGEITAPSNTIFTLTGNNTEGFTLTGASGTLSQTTVSTSSSNDRVIDWNGNNNLWKIEANANATNTFALSNSTNVAVEYYNGWKTEYSTSYNNRSYTAMRLYIPKSVYNSNPSPLTVPIVAFEKGGTTLYLDANDKTYTNTASVTGVSKTINYSSDNTSVATVNASGVVTAVGIGTATITARVDAELGVSTSASDTYEITVKSATTLAGIKAQATSSTAVDFTADFASDLVITYVNGTHAYLQSGDVAVYAAAGEGWEAGKKFTGAISGKVKVANSQYQITVIDQTPATGGVIPDAIAVDIADLTAENYATYEGRKVAIAGAKISTAMANTATSGGVISDGTNTLNINAPEKGVALTLNEKGNFTGYIGRYNTGIRLYMYAQGWFTKTHNAPKNQSMAFETSAYNFDEETDAVTSFTGQAVTQTTVKGTLTYNIKEGGDGIITSLNASTGAVVLNGDCGTATIVATAAYTEIEEDGYLTPYPELNKEYTVTVRPRYTVTFSINGNTDEIRRQASYGAAITAPEVAAIGDYVFKGWSDAIVYSTDVAPTMETGASITPTSTKTVYAVFAIQTQTGTTDVEDQSYSYSENNWTVGGSYTDMSSSSPKYYMLHNGGYVESAEFDLSIISKVVVYGGYYGGSNYTSISISDGTNTWKDVNVSGNSQTGTNTFTGGAALTGTGKLRITSTCGSSSTPNGVRITGFKIYKLGPVYGYSGYCTSLPISVSLTANTWATYCFGEDVTIPTSDPNLKVYRAKFNSSTNELTATPISGKIKAGEGVLLKTTTAGTTEYEFVTTTGASPLGDDNDLIGTIVATPTATLKGSEQYLMVLKKNDNKFVRYEGETFPANRACLAVTPENTNAPSAFRIVEEEQNATNIQNIESNDDVVKFFENGQLFIKKNGIVYDAVGRRVR